MGFPDVSDGKESACNVGDLGSIPGLRRSPGEGSDYPLQYSYLENPHGQRSLAGYNPWGHKESDMTTTFNTANNALLLLSKVLTCRIPRKSGELPEVWETDFVNHCNS